MEYDKEKGCYSLSTCKRCVHGKSSKHDCKDCNPEKYCFEHNMPMRMCGKCAKHPSICEHHRRRTRCVDCAREHGGKTATVKTGGVCMHNRRKYQCTECSKLGLINENERSEICPCAIRKRYCRIHGGANLCSICFETTVLQAGTTCSRCNLDTTKPVRLKKREIEVMEWIVELPPYTAYNKSLASILRKNIETGDEVKLLAWFNLIRETKTYYPDFMWTMPEMHVILEIDEHQHKKVFQLATGSNYTKDRQRETDMVQQIAHICDKQIVFVRYNPDAFQTGFKPRAKHLSMLTSRDARKTTLLDTMRAVMQSRLEGEFIPLLSKRIVYIRLFFDCSCTCLETCMFKHAWGFDSVDEFKCREV
jgi:hypothetical protein